jgi:hypothetical protein
MELVFIFFSNQAYLDAVSYSEKDMAVSASGVRLKPAPGCIELMIYPPLKETLE